MPRRLPVTLDFGTLPQTGAGYTPQQFANILGTNGAIFTEQEFALFVTGSTAPTSDVGPWLANGNEWRVWDDNEGAYVPITIDQGSLGYIVSDTEPDPTIYQFWIKTAVGGSPLGVFTYYSGAWTDVYASTIGGYLTVTAFNTAIANYSTTAQMNTAITTAANAAQAAAIASSNAYTDAAIAGIPSADQHAAVSTATGQTELANGTTYAATGLSYVAPVTGQYLVAVVTQFDNSGADASNMQITLAPTVNGVAAGQGSAAAEVSPTGSRWFPGFTELVSASAGDTISMSFTPLSSAGSVVLTAVKMSVVLALG